MVADLKVINDLSGHKYKEWDILHIDQRMTDEHPYNKIYWVCKCKCGTIQSFDGLRLRTGKTRKNCGCKRRTQENKTTKEKRQKKRFKNTWRGLFERCYNTSHIEYHNYGAKAITVHEEWHIFEGFEQDMWQSYLDFEAQNGESSATIERIDITNGYNKENCTWKTQLEQARNRSTNISVEVRGKTYATISLLAEDYPELPYHTIMARYNKDKRGEDLIAPVKRNHALKNKRTGVRG